MGRIVLMTNKITGLNEWVDEPPKIDILQDMYESRINGEFQKLLKLVPNRESNNYLINENDIRYAYKLVKNYYVGFEIKIEGMRDDKAMFIKPFDIDQLEPYMFIDCELNSREDDVILSESKFEQVIFTVKTKECQNIGGALCPKDGHEYCILIKHLNIVKYI